MRLIKAFVGSTRRLALALCIGGSAVLCLTAFGQTAKDPTVAPPPEPTKTAAEVIDPALPTIWIASDSTAANGGPNATGWGVPFPSYFDLTKVNVVNRARGGRSSRTFITEGLWAKLLEGVKAGDTVLIQFGHNDAGAINEDASVPRERWRSRGSIPGLGEETEEIDNVITKKHEVVHTYGWYMRKMIADTQAKGATPIVLSITVRNEWKDGKVERNNGPWRKFSHDLAETAGIAYIDLTRLIADKYQELGPDKVKTFFPRDHTHTGPEGADLNASLVVAGLKGIRKGPYAALLSPKGAAVEADRIGWLNLPEPANPQLPSVVLIGDSTVRNGGGDGGGGQWGWGEPLAEMFDPKCLNLVNRAIGGLSSRTFLTQGHWARALTLLKPGDWVVMQFGHNDNGPLNDTSRARGTIKGTGDESEEIDNMLTGGHETVHTYGWYLRRYIRDAKERGVIPVVCTPIPRKTWVDGHIKRDRDSYAGWAAQVAEEEGVALIDLNEAVASRYDEMGSEKVEAMFADPHTHTSRAGAELNAGIVAAALRRMHGFPCAGTSTP